MRIRELCTRDVDVVGPADTVRAAAERMRQREVGSLVVVDDLGLPSGVVTDRDIVLRCTADGLDPNATKVEHVMTRGAETIHEDLSVEDAVDRMSRAALSRLVVVDAKGLLTGLLSVDDVLVHVTGEVARLGELASVRRCAPTSV